jgi:hypothetical protein
MKDKTDLIGEIKIAYLPKFEIICGILLIPAFGLGLIFIAAGVYHLLLEDKVVVNKKRGISRHKKFIWENYTNNKFANCIEYDYKVQRSIIDVIFGTSEVDFSIKVRRGINDYSQESLSYTVDKADEEKLIGLLSDYFDAIKVKI